jgi:hypothetical protein
MCLYLYGFNQPILDLQIRYKCCFSPDKSFDLWLGRMGFEPIFYICLCIFKLGFSCFPCAWFITNFQYRHVEAFE